MQNARSYSRSVLFHDNELWVIGGMNDSGALSSVEVFDLGSLTWSVGPSLSIPKIGPTAWVSGGRIYIGGGTTSGSSAFTNSIERFNPAVNDWESFGNIPESIVSKGFAVLDNRIFTAGGHKSGDASNKVYMAELLPHRDLYFRSITSEKENSAPTSIFVVGDLTISENQPVGAIVGEFNATDPDANATLTHHLVSGAGDGSNSLFTLETNGILRTATTFDYETDASTYSIRVQAKDEFNATVEGNFTVMLNDVSEFPAGASNFQKSVIDSYANAARYVYSADLDGDGDEDVLSASIVSPNGGISWYQNDGQQNFTEIVIDSNGQESVVASDFDGDGDIDVISSGKDRFLVRK